MVYNQQKKLQSVTTDPTTGDLIGIYADGTHEKITSGTPATTEQIANYAKMVQQYGQTALSILPKNIQQQVMAYIGQNGMSPTEKPITQEITNPDGTKTTMQWNQGTNSWSPIQAAE